MRRNVDSHGGFTLIEVLVAVVVLSIGLLGLASLQTVTLQRANGSAQRVDALDRAYDLLDRMRANRSQALAGRYDVDLGSVPTGTSLADTDVRTWKQALAASLPDGDASVVVDSGTVSISVTWTDIGAGGGAGALNLRTQL